MDNFDNYWTLGAGVDLGGFLAYTSKSVSFGTVNNWFVLTALLNPQYPVERKQMPNRVSIAESIEKLTGSIFENFRPNLWLQDESAKLLSEGGNYFPFVALGLVSRLCARNIPKNERKAILAKFPASEQPARRIATWWKNHRETCWPELEEVTLKKTVAITTLIFDMRSLDIESLTETATTWVKKRDNIESIARLVGKDADRFLRPLLAETDRLAKRNRDNFSAVNYDKRLCAVSMCDPAAWWASLPAIQPEKKGKAA